MRRQMNGKHSVEDNKSDDEREETIPETCAQQLRFSQKQFCKRRAHDAFEAEPRGAKTQGNPHTLGEQSAPLRVWLQRR